MSRERWIVSMLIAYHLVAVSSHLLPEPSLLNRDVSQRTDGNRLVSVLQPPLDLLASAVRRAEATLFLVTAPVRRVTQPYIDAGLRQYWAMFSDPDVEDHYVRLDYSVDPVPSGRSEVLRELVFPADREDQIKVYHHHADKAVVNSFDRFSKRAGGRSETGENVTSPLAPLARYFAGRLERTRGDSVGRVSRVNVWYGIAPNRTIGLVADPASVDARQAVLRRYAETVVSVTGTASSSLGTHEREADIVWTLEYVYIP